MTANEPKVRQMVPGWRRSLTVTVLSAVGFLAIVVVSGGIISGYVSRAFDLSQQIYRVQLAAQDALRLQLDAETGIRGLAATGEPAFLEPYRSARISLGPELDRLSAAVQCCGLASAAPFVADARRTAGLWEERVAQPIIRRPHEGGTRIERYGKQLIDRYRADFAQVDAIVELRGNEVASDVRIAIDRINWFRGSLVALLGIATIAYALEQSRAAARIREQERIAENERRQQAELRAAYEAEKRIADTLQDAFTQRPLPQLDMLHFSASYVPAAEDARVGGDWYEAISLGTNKVFFAIGDVTGHGIEAAVTMNRARQALISAALVDADPGALLDRVNADFERYEHDVRLVTAIAGIADAEIYEFCYAVAGHPPPILVEPGRPPRFLEFGSLPLGSRAEGVSYVTKRVQSVPGAILVLYTDGALEFSRDVLEGERVLLEAVAEARDQAALAAAPFIHKAIFTGRPVGDDVAILTVSFANERASRKRGLGAGRSARSALKRAS